MISNWQISFILLSSLQIISLIYFLNGFIPFSNPIATRETVAATTTSSQAIIDRFVFIVIDGLRMDFMFGPNTNANFPGVSKLMTEKRVICQGLSLRPPSVTMPKIKTLMTGFTAQFSDILQNFNSPALNEDNLIHRLASARRFNKGWPLHFCGDDTWQKLFPNDFVRSEGISSFYVNDFHEVDLNVTRCLETSLPSYKENENGDELTTWRGLFLHYLGVDHIGHVRGPTGHEMPPKLRQMDEIIMKIYNNLNLHSKSKNERWIIAVTGDHGMHNQGGHGGASVEELNVPFVVLMSPKLLENYKTSAGVFTSSSSEFALSTCQQDQLLIDQTDVAVSLGLLTNVGIPSRSQGQIIPKLLPMFGAFFDQIEALNTNVQHLRATYSHLMINLENEIFDNVTKLHKYLKVNCQSNKSKDPKSPCNDETLKNHLQKFSYVESLFKNNVIKSTKLYDIPLMASGIIMLLICSCLWLRYLTSSDLPNLQLHRPIRLQLLFVFGSFLTGIVHFLICSFSQSTCSLCDISSPLTISLAPTTGLAMTLLFGMMGFSVWCDARFLWQFKPTTISRTAWFLFIGSVLQIVCLGSSSCVEEEHTTWYFFTASLHFILLIDLWYHCCYRQDYQLLASTTTLRQIQPPLYPMLGLLLVTCIDRFTRTINQSGDQWKYLEDFGDILSKEENHFYLTCLIFISYVCIALLLVVEKESVKYSMPTALLVLLGQFLYRDLLDSSFEHATVVHINYGFILLDLACNLFLSGFQRQRIFGCFFRSFFFLLLLLCKPVNVFLWFFILLKERLLAFCFSHFCDFYFNHVPLLLAVVYYWYGMFSFFVTGHSNNLATVHISAAFVGLGSYHPILSGLLLALHTYSGPMFWFMAFVYRFGFYFHNNNAHKYVYTFSTLLSVCLFVYSAICIHLRDHLFIWSVFAPKFLFLSFNTIMNAILCCLVVVFFIKK